MDESALTLEVLIATCGPDGGQKVAAMNLPELPRVSYLVSWQEPGGSGIPETLSARDDVRIIILEGFGLSRNRNNCLDNARGDILLIADDDLELIPEGLESILAIFGKNPGLEYGSFRYDSDVPKEYPEYECSLDTLPRNFYQTSFEIALRRDSRAGRLRFPENFGLGSTEGFTAGEEELLLKKARINSICCHFFPVTIARHKGPTTGVRQQLADGAIRARGTLTAVEYPLTSILRIPVVSLRIARAGQAGFLKALRLMIAGAWAARAGNVVKPYLKAPLDSDIRDCRLTVVIPVYNRAQRVMDTLHSLKAQTLRPLKIVLVDNNSSDNTLQVLLDWQQKVSSPEFDVTVVEENTAGAAAARNRGFREVTTPLTMFFDSDDLMAPGHCLRAVREFEANPEADIIGWDCETVTHSGKTFRTTFHAKDCLWANLQFGSMATQRYAARSDIFRKAGGWNPDCRGWNDIELGQRILMMNPRIRKAKETSTVTIIATTDSITGPDFSSKTKVWEHALDLMEESANNKEPHISLTRMIRLRRAILAGDYRHEGDTAASKRLLASLLASEPSSFYRMLYRLASAYRGIGLHGIARIMRFFF